MTQPSTLAPESIFLISKPLLKDHDFELKIEFIRPIYSIFGEGNSNPLLVFLPGEFHEQRSLGGYSPWDHKELDTTE